MDRRLCPVLPCENHAKFVINRHALFRFKIFENILSSRVCYTGFRICGKVRRYGLDIYIARRDTQFELIDLICLCVCVYVCMYVYMYVCVTGGFYASLLKGGNN